jgi:hypothetical protein
MPSAKAPTAANRCDVGTHSATLGHPPSVREKTTRADWRERFVEPASLASDLPSQVMRTAGPRACYGSEGWRFDSLPAR